MITVYDQDMNMLAVLDYADGVGYNLTHNDLWTASFRLPNHDPKNQYCQMHNLVRISDGPRDIGLYRIIGIPNDAITDAGGYTEYSCEHVAATLLDDVLFGYHEIGGVGIRTADVIRYILDRQAVKRWQLGACEFSGEFAYKFENDSLLSALLSLGDVLTEPYTWDFDTTTAPWTVNLRRADMEAGCGIYYMRNLQGITRTVDASTLVTRLYLLGYGEGINQLTIKDINGGVPYLDADTIGTYGVKASVFTDRRLESPELLKARGEQLLESLKIPYITYTASATDLVQLTGDAWDEFMPGKVVHVLDGADGVEFEARIVSVTKADASGRPGDVEITIANSVRDIADSINTLADRQGINELYSQGATNLYAQQYADNADADHPAEMRVYIPSGCVRINQMLLSYDVSAFRAYETGAAAGGSSNVTSAAGGASTQTSSGGGASTQTSGGGGASTLTQEQKIVTTEAVTGGTISGHSGDTSGNTGGPYQSSATKYTTDNNAAQTTGGSSLNSTDSGGGSISTSEAGNHSHKMGSHTHGISHTHNWSGKQSLANGHTHKIITAKADTNTGGVSTNGTHNVSLSGTTGGSSKSSTDSAGSAISTAAAGAHRHTMGGHTHGMKHTHSVPAHSHGMNHYHNFSHTHNVTARITIPAITLNVPSHTHSVSVGSHTHTVNIPSHTHQVQIDAHTHDIVYGIYEGDTASKITVKVDGAAVPGVSAANMDELDIVQWLAKDDEGKITRGTWHTVELVPDRLTRIEANLFVQTFVQSVGGGDY